MSAPNLKRKNVMDALHGIMKKYEKQSTNNELETYLVSKFCFNDDETYKLDLLKWWSTK